MRGGANVAGVEKMSGLDEVDIDGIIPGAVTPAFRFDVAFLDPVERLREQDDEEQVRHHQAASGYFLQEGHGEKLSVFTNIVDLTKIECFNGGNIIGNELICVQHMMPNRLLREIISLLR